METTKSNINLIHHWDAAWFVKDHRRVMDDKKRRLHKMQTWYADGKFLDYILRDEAVLSTDLSKEQMEEIFVLKDECKKQWENYRINKHITEDDKHLSKKDQEKYDDIHRPMIEKNIEFMNLNTEASFSGLHSMDAITENVKKISLDDIQKEYDSFSKIDKEHQVIWTGVLSFDTDYINKNKLFDINNMDKYFAKNIKSWLKRSNWTNQDLKNAKIGWSYHINTDNLHIHYYIHVPTPTRQYWINNGFISRTSLDPYFTKYGFRNSFDKNLINSNESLMESKKQLRSWSDDVLISLKSLNDYSKVDLNINKNKIIRLLTRFKEFQKENYDELKNAKSYGSKQTSEHFRKKINDLALELIESVPKVKEDFNKFKEITKKTANANFERYLMYSKLPKEFSVPKDLIIDPNDERLNIKKQDYELYKNRKKYEPKDYKNDYWTFLKDKKISLEQEHLYSKNRKGYCQGIISDYGRKVFELLKTKINIPRAKDVNLINKNINKTNAKINNKAQKEFAPYINNSQKYLTNKRKNNSEYRFKKMLAELDFEAKKRTIKAQREFERLTVEIEKKTMEEQQEWNKQTVS